MKDRFEAVAQKVQETWGPLPLRSIGDAMICVREAIDAATSDSNVKTALYALLLKALEDQEVDDSSFINSDLILAILEDHAQKNTTLYLYQGSIAHVAEPELNYVQKAVNGLEVGAQFCEHPAMHPKKALYDEWTDALTEGHKHLERIIENAPSNATNCEVSIDMIDDGSLIPLGRWVWDAKNQEIFWSVPERQ